MKPAPIFEKMNKIRRQVDGGYQELLYPQTKELPVSGRQNRLQFFIKWVLKTISLCTRKEGLAAPQS